MAMQPAGETVPETEGISLMPRGDVRRPLVFGRMA